MPLDDIRQDSPTEIMRVELYADRWGRTDRDSGLVELAGKPSPDTLRQLDLFRDLDDAFLEEIGPDVSISTWNADSILFEEGSYIDLAFFLIEGEVDIFLASVDQGQSPIFDTERTVVFGDLDSSDATSGASLYASQILAQTGGSPTMLSCMDFDLPRGSAMRLGPGELFGEIGALSGWPQSVTARTASECRLLQIRLPALRKLKKKSTAFKERADALYRERSLFFHLRRIPLFEGCGDTFVRSLVDSVELVSCKPDEIVATEGEAADAMYIVRSGFLKLAQGLAAGHVAVGYLSKGMSFGETELLIDGVDTWTTTASSVGYSELVKIPTAEMHDIIAGYPDLEEGLWQGTIDRIKETGYTRKHLNHSELLEFSLESGLVQGNSILVIDLNSCTRCDDCVRACADTHGGRPRFVREGERYENFLITRSCFHCRDPVCLVGCPTGAIHRADVGDVVDIQEDICIGCSSCANKCPYDAITMVGTGGTWPDNAIPSFLRGKARQVASKCDLCYTSKAGPACVKNCPQGCAMRIGTVDEFRSLSEEP